MTFPRSRQREIDDEVQAHLRMSIRDRVARGEDPIDAERRARLEFGNDLLVRETTRDMWGGRRFERWIQNCRYALRQMRRTPGFTAIAVLTLAIGIGAVAAITAVVDSVLVHPLAYADPGRLYTVVNVPPPGIAERYWSVNGRYFHEWRAHCRSCEDVAMAEGIGVTLAGTGDAVRLSAWRVSYNFLRTLGVRPALGRDFLPEEELPGQFQKLILTDATWRAQFAADPGIIGRTVRVSDEPYVIVGVLPADFRVPVGNQWGPRFGPPAQPTMFRPLGQDFSQASPVGNNNYIAAVRLKQGTQASEAVAELRALVADFVRQYHIQIQPTLLPLQDTVVRDARDGLVLLLGIVVTLLLLVCLNVGNLMLVRTTGRHREVAIRMALGSSRSQLFSLILNEALLLVVAGSAAGVLFAQVALNAFAAWAPPELPRVDEIHVGPRVWLVTVVLAAICTVICGLLPAWRMSRTNPHHALKTGAQHVSADGRSLRLREWMVSIEVALSTVLLVVGGLLALSFMRVWTAPKGIDVDNVLIQDVPMSGPRFNDPARYRVAEDALARFAAIPGVRSVGVTNQLPLRGEAWTCALRDAMLPNTPETVIANYRFVNSGYWDALGIAVRDGRVFEPADRSRDVAVISERTARFLWPGQNPIGKRVTSCGTNRPESGLDVVGVVADVRAGVELDAPYTIYQPYWNYSGTRYLFALRTREEPLARAGDARRVIKAIDPQLPIVPALTMRTVLDEAVAARRFQLSLAAVFAVFALALASLGIYGVISYVVARRTPELGIRLALGARASRLAAMVVREGMRPVFIGLGAGTACALVAGRLVASQLYGVTPRDPLTLVAVALVLTVVGVGACLLPARRAMRINPLSAIRSE